MGAQNRCADLLVVYKYTFLYRIKRCLCVHFIESESFILFFFALLCRVALRGFDFAFFRVQYSKYSELTRKLLAWIAFDLVFVQLKLDSLTFEQITHWYWCRHNNVHYFDASVVFEPFLFYLSIKWQRFIWHFDRPTLQIQYFCWMILSFSVISFHIIHPIFKCIFIPQFHMPNIEYIEYEIVYEYFESQLRNSILQIIDFHSIWFRIVSVHDKLKTRTWTHHKWSNFR